MPASYLGSKTGQTHALLTRSIFGVTGSALVSVLLIGVAAGWTAFAFNLLATLYDGLFGWGHVIAISVALAVVGITNNLFGFTGITAFARYLVAPLMIAWVLYLTIKGLTQIPAHALTASRKTSAPLPFLTGAGVAIGSVMWGNEPDTWRYGKPRFAWPAIPYLAAMAVGLVLFVAGGWMMADLSKAGPFDFGPAFRFTVGYSLFGALWLGAIVATVLQFAINDGNYYEMINGGQNVVGHLRGWRRLYTCLLMMAIATLSTWWFPHLENGFFKVAGWSAIALPCATVVMCVDQFVLPRLGGQARDTARIPSWRQAGLGNWPGIVAACAGIAFGAWGLVLLPGQTSAPSLGIVPLEAWLLSGVVYLALAGLAGTLPQARTLLGFARMPNASAGPSPAGREPDEQRLT
jgi:purine-cytosine permease-like protein